MVVVNGRLIEQPPPQGRAAPPRARGHDQEASRPASERRRPRRARLAPARRLVLRGLRGRPALRPRHAAHDHRRRRRPLHRADRRAPAGALRRARRARARAPRPARWTTSSSSTSPSARPSRTSRYNAVANLGYADLRFLEPVYAGDTLTAQSEVIGLKQNSSGTSGVVYVRSRALNQHGARGALLGALGHGATSATPRRARPGDGRAGPAARGRRPRSSRCPRFLAPAALEAAATGGARLLGRLRAGRDASTIPARMTRRGSRPHARHAPLPEHRARALRRASRPRGGPFGRRLVYGGHVISLCRALSYDGLENAFAIAAINGGTHANPTFAGDTIYCPLRSCTDARRASRPRRRRARCACACSA